MKKNNNYAYLILAILFILFNVIAFSVPIQRTTSFYISYAFSCVAFISQIFIWKVAFKNSNSLKSKFLGISIIYVGNIYLTIQLISFIVFMCVSNVQIWVSILVSSLILGLSAISLISAKAGKEEVESVDNKIKLQTEFIKNLGLKLEKLLKNVKESEIKLELKNLIEKIKFSDPMSNQKLSEIENEIKLEISDLEKYINSSDNEKIKNSLSKVNDLIEERNSICKLSK